MIGTFARYVESDVCLHHMTPLYNNKLTCSINISATISGAHLNPAATLGLALAKELKWSLVPVYMVAQYLGGFLASLVLFVNYAEAINSLDGGVRSAYGNGTASTGGIFATYPAEYVSVYGSLLDQTIGTAVLLFALMAVTDSTGAGPKRKHQPIHILFVVCSVCIAFSPNCGAIFNPARDLAPRLMTYVVGYSNPSVWSPTNNLYWLTAGLVGPHIGAIIGIFAYKLLADFRLSCSSSDLTLERYVAASNQPHQQPQQRQHNQQDSQRTSEFIKAYPENISYGGQMSR